MGLIGAQYSLYMASDTHPYRDGDPPCALNDLIWFSDIHPYRGGTTTQKRREPVSSATPIRAGVGRLKHLMILLRCSGTHPHRDGIIAANIAPDRVSATPIRTGMELSSG